MEKMDHLWGAVRCQYTGVEYNTGSLGHVLGICAGLCLGFEKSSNNKAIALIGDAECDEGSIWEAIFFAAEHKLSNLVCVIDRNRLSVTKVMESEVIFGNFKQKLELFGWNCHIINGHSFDQILDTFDVIANSDKPTMILAETIKGKGVSFMENEISWHHSVPSAEQIVLAKKELGR
jgi:Transketolase, N-terminal subunit